MPDHLGPQLAPFPALMAAAAATTTLRVATLVAANDFRHPVVMASDAAALDLLSDGRLELGVGAGWMRADYDAADIFFAPASTRVERLEEAVMVLRALLRGEPHRFAGEHYSVDLQQALPRPAQQSIPILIGGGGRRVLAVAGRHADIVSINLDLRSGDFGAETWRTGSAAATRRKLAWLRDAAGDRADELELNLDLLAVVTDDWAGTLDELGRVFGLGVDELAESPHVLVGSVEEITDQLAARRDQYGFSYITVTEDAMRPMAPVVSRLAGR
jgi:probable F420-dependent oxidoreductase